MAELDQDPFKERICDEVEEFLRDLTLEFPFEDIFESLRRFEYKNRYGPKVVPIPKIQNKAGSEPQTKDIRHRIGSFLNRLDEDFGQNYSDYIRQRFRYYTETTWE